MKYVNVHLSSDFYYLCSEKNYQPKGVLLVININQKSNDFNDLKNTVSPVTTQFF